MGLEKPTTELGVIARLKAIMSQMEDQAAEMLRNQKLEHGTEDGRVPERINSNVSGQNNRLVPQPTMRGILRKVIRAMYKNEAEQPTKQQETEWIKAAEEQKKQQRSN